VALVGPWGIGKTSLIRRFVHMVREFDPPVLPVAVTVTPAVASPEQFAAELLRRIREEIDGTQEAARWPERLVSELRQWEPSVGWGPVRAHRRARSTEYGPDLYRELRRLWHEYLNNRVPGIVFFLDDANALLSRDPDSLMSLRGLFQDLQGAGARYPLVITGPDDMFITARDASEPVTRFFDRMVVGSFDLDDARDAIEGPMRAVDLPCSLTEASIGAVWARTEGHAFFLAFAMRNIVREAMRAGLTVVDEEFIQHCWPAVADHLARERFEADWMSASPAEQRLLATLAGEPQGPISHSVGRAGFVALGRMVTKGLIVRNRRGDYHLYHPLFQDFVRRQPKE
jgi:hypothetical protein